MFKLPQHSIARLLLSIVLLLAGCHFSVLAQRPVQLTNVADNPAPGVKYVDELTMRALNGNLYFRAINRSEGPTRPGDPRYVYPYKPYASNGTPAGSRQLSTAFTNADVDFTEYNGKIYFVIPYLDIVPSRALYVTDGTEAGTTLVKSFLGSFSSLSEGLFVVNGRLYFAVLNEMTGRHDLWVSDGTGAGTVLLKSLTGRDYFQFTPANNTLYFVAEDTTGSPVLWVTDGTADGTQPLADGLGVSTGGKYPRELTNVGNKLFYAFSGSGGGYGGLWITDNTAGGTRMVAGGSYSPRPGVTLPFFIVSPQQLAAGPDNKLIFRASGQGAEDEPWISDGTPEGTFPLDVSPGDVASFPVIRPGMNYNGRYYFNATRYLSGESVTGVFSTDGTRDGTRLVAATPRSTGNFTLFDGKLAFTAGSQLWITDGTEGGTTLLAAFGGTFGSTVIPTDLIRADGKLYFLTLTISPDTPHLPSMVSTIGTLWESNGTPAGTRSFYDADETFRRVLPRSLRTLDDKLHFVASKKLTSLTDEEGKDLFRLESGTTGKALTLLPPTYDCESGKIVFNVSGGDGSVIKYEAPGVIRKNVTDNYGVVDEKLRKNPEKILIQAYQNQETSKFLFDLPNACKGNKGGRLGATTEPGSGLSIKTLGNPVLGERVNVEIRGAAGQPLTLTVMDMQGRAVHTQQVKQAAATETRTIQLGRTSGTYLLRVSSPTQKQTMRLLRE